MGVLHAKSSRADWNESEPQPAGNPNCDRSGRPGGDANDVVSSLRCRGPRMIQGHGIQCHATRQKGAVAAPYKIAGPRPQLASAQGWPVTDQPIAHCLRRHPGAHKFSGLGVRSSQERSSTHREEVGVGSQIPPFNVRVRSGLSLLWRPWQYQSWTRRLVLGNPSAVRPGSLHESYRNSRIYELFLGSQRAD